MTSHSVRADLLAAGAPAEREPISNLIARHEPALTATLDTPETVAYLELAYLELIRRDPVLLEATGESVLAALLLTAQLDLDPLAVDHVYLTPTRAGCVWTLGYGGLAELVRAGGVVGGLRARLVWDCDECRVWEDEKGDHFLYIPGEEAERRERRYALVTWKERAAGTWFARVAVVPLSRLAEARRVALLTTGAHGPWSPAEDAMYAKTAVLSVRPALPLDALAAYAAGWDGRTVAALTVDEHGAAQPEPAHATQADESEES